MKNITFIRKWAAVVLLQWLFCITTLYAEDRFPVFAFNGIPPSHDTRAYYKDMAAAVFNISLTICKDMQEVQKVLDAARGTGVRIAVVGDDIRDRSKQFVERFGNDEALYG